jgi:hypothetical protein
MEPKKRTGGQAYLEAVQAAYTENDDTFMCETMHVSGDGQRIISMLCNNHGCRGCDFFNLGTWKTA